MLALLPTLALIAPLAFGTPATAASPASPTDAERAEVSRLQRHFDGALARLAQRDISGLTVDQRARRGALTVVLRAYRDRALFPHNYDFPGEAIPYFIDRRTGVLCAVANLMEHTGRRDLVDAVADADNNVWVHELAGNAEFRSWLHANGLTLEEAARIQAPYIGEMPDPPAVVAARASTSSMTAATFASAGTVALLQFVPQLKASRTGALLSFAAGTFAASTAARGLEVRADPQLAGLTIAAGVLNYYYAGRTFARYRAAERTRRANIAPIIPATREQGAGLVISFTF